MSIESIGTDPLLGHSRERGTGMYRIPSLRGVSSRGPLLHDGSIATVEDLFDPRRIETLFDARRHGDGPVHGHEFGLGLSASDRAALVAYLRTL